MRAAGRCTSWPAGPGTATTSTPSTASAYSPPAPDRAPRSPTTIQRVRPARRELRRPRTPPTRSTEAPRPRPPADRAANRPTAPLSRRHASIHITSATAIGGSGLSPRPDEVSRQGFHDPVSQEQRALREELLAELEIPPGWANRLATSVTRDAQRPDASRPPHECLHATRCRPRARRTSSTGTTCTSAGVGGSLPPRECSPVRTCLEAGGQDCRPNGRWASGRTR